MEDCKTYFDWGTWIVPILVVLITGALAFWQMNYRNKQERINKWKDEFRNYMGQYSEIIVQLNNEVYSRAHEASTDKIIDNDLWPERNKVMSIITRIEMLLDSSNPHYIQLNECFRKQIGFMNENNRDVIKKTKKDFLVELIYEPHNVAKKIHREYKG